MIKVKQLSDSGAGTDNLLVYTGSAWAARSHGIFKSPDNSTTAAVADNLATTAAIFEGKANGTAVFTIGATGAVTLKSVAYSISSKTANYTVVATDSTLLGDASGGAFTFTLPTAASMTGRVFIFKKTDTSSNAITIDGNGSETIEGATTFLLAAQGDCIWIQSTGTEWFIL